MNTTRRGLLAAIGGAALAGCAAPVESGQANDPSVVTETDDTELPREAVTEEAAAETAYGSAYEQVVPSVVQVRAEDGEPIGQGSGFRVALEGVDDDGNALIATNDHVLPPDSTYRVQFHEDEWDEARLLGRDPYSDLAVLQVENQPAYVDRLPLAVDAAAIGEEVLAIGAPFEFEGSVSLGIISGTGRSLPGPRGFSIADTIQTDAAVNPGNSGGPLVTLDGEVVGVVTATRGENIGLAVSAALASRVLPALATDGEYEHSYLGIRSLEVEPLLAEANDLPEPQGVLIVEIPDDSPSEGILRGSTEEATVDGVSYPAGGDVIRGLDDVDVSGQSDLSRYLTLQTSPGDEVEVTILRDGTELTETVTLGTRPDPGAPVTEPPS